MLPRSLRTESAPLVFDRFDLLPLPWEIKLISEAAPALAMSLVLRKSGLTTVRHAQISAKDVSVEDVMESL